MSPFLHQWLTATQYAAPLMANFDTQLGNNSHIHYAMNSKWKNPITAFYLPCAFTRQWPIEVIQSSRGGHQTLSVMWLSTGWTSTGLFRQHLVYSWPSLTQAILEQENFSKHVSCIGLYKSWFFQRGFWFPWKWMSGVSIKDLMGKEIRKRKK